MTTTASCPSTLVYDLIIPQGVDWPGVDFPIVGPDGEDYDLTGVQREVERDSAY